MPRVGAPGQANWVPPPQVTRRRWQPRLPKPSAARVSGEARHGSAPDESPREHLPRAEGPPPALSVRPLRRQGWGGEPKSLSESLSSVPSHQSDTWMGLEARAGGSTARSPRALPAGWGLAGGGAGEGGCPHSPQTMPAASQGPGAQKDPDARRQAHGSGALPQDKQRKSYLGLKVKDEMSPEEDSCLHKNSDNSACDPALCPEAEARERAPNAGPTASRAHAVS